MLCSLSTIHLLSRLVSSVSSSDSHICCCICHCAVDYSDREAFFANDSNESNNNNMVLLPSHLYDSQNTLVLCDTCDRPFHQQCHFVPLIPLPRGDWHCLLCKSKTSSSSSECVYPFPPTTATATTDKQQQDSTTTTTAQWEYESRTLKATTWKREFARLQRSLSTQLQHVRLAQDTLRAHTSTKRAQDYLSLQSQELQQTIYKLSLSKLRIRQWFLALDKVRCHPDQEYQAVREFVQEHESQEIKWFPYGTELERRVVPRLVVVVVEEDKNEQKKNEQKEKKDVPSHIVVDSKTKEDNQEDDDDMISLDDLQCCICFRGDATDDNDLILCDGEGCFRAYHMQCVSPHITALEAEEEEDWFCPLCTAMAKLIANVQSEYTGDEWGLDGEGDTVVSWEHAQDVFPEAEKEYEMAMRWKQGEQTEEMAEFLSSMLGIPVSEGKNGDAQDDIDDDDDDPEDDDFDLQAFQQRNREPVDSDSVASSLATLQDMSSVEIDIDRTELDALSLDSSDEEENQGRRRTRSSRVASTDASSSDSSKPRVDVGTLDESNILGGKRRRKAVDYRRLVLHSYIMVVL